MEDREVESLTRGDSSLDSLCDQKKKPLACLRNNLLIFQISYIGLLSLRRSSQLDAGMPDLAMS